MRELGVRIGLFIALGVHASGTWLPLGVPGALGVTAGTLGIATCFPRATLAVPAALGLLRGCLVERRRERTAIREPRVLRGRVRVVGRLGAGLVLRGGDRRVLLSDPPEEIPSPGRELDAVLRLDPFGGRADPSSFRADRWAARHDLSARAKLLAEPESPRDTPGVAAGFRRAAERVRRSALERLGRGETSAGDLVSALLLGDRTGLPRSELEAFRRAGLAHVLALSGMHVGVLALGLASLLRAARIRGVVTLLSLLTFLISFAFLTGASPPILRACGTAGVAALGVAAGRRPRSLHTLGWVAGILLLVNPRLLEDVGFRLSFLAAALLCVLAGRCRPARGPFRSIAEAFWVSTIVTVGTLPEIATAFGRVSLLSPVTNLVAGPLAAAALGWGGLGAFAPLPSPLAEAFARAARGAAGLLEVVVRTAAPVPDLPLPAPGPSASALIVGAAFLLAARRRPGRLGLVLGLGLAAVVLASARPRDRLSLLDVGQGDAILIESGGERCLVDGGPIPWGGGPPPVVAALGWRGALPLDRVWVTHGHADHAGGVHALVAAGAVEWLAVGSRPGDAPALLERIVATAGSRAIPVVAVDGALELAGGTVQVSRPPGADRSPSENDRSLLTKWTAAGAGAWLLGDVSSPVENSWISDRAPSRLPILLAPHHGSRDSTGDSLLARLRPSLVLISCGTANPHGHPHAETLERVRGAGAALLRTDRDGSVRVTATRRGFRLHWQRGYPGPRQLFPGFALSGKPRFP